MTGYHGLRGKTVLIVEDHTDYREMLALTLRTAGSRVVTASNVSEARREVVMRVRRPCIAVDAAVLATLVGIDRAVEADVGRVVARDDRARLLDRHRGGERR